MPDKTEQEKENDFIKICQRLDKLTDFIEKGLKETEDIHEIRSVVEELRANLLKTIDDRVEYIFGNQSRIYELHFDQIEDRLRVVNESIRVVNEGNRRDLEIIKSKLMSDIKKIQEEIDKSIKRTDVKLQGHLDQQIDWKKIAAPAIVTALIPIVIFILLAFIDRILGWNLLEIFGRAKP